MKRTLPAAVLVALAAVAGCGSEAAPGSTGPAPASAPAPASSPAPSSPSAAGDGTGAAAGVPPLQGDPTDLTAPVQAGAGSGEPPAELVTEDLVVGEGPAATLADTVAVRYTGTLYSDGTLFDSSWMRGDEPTTFPLNGVVPGFAQGIEGMQPGGRRVIVIPPDLGYGDASPSPTIPPGSTLVFVVDLVAINGAG